MQKSNIMKLKKRLVFKRNLLCFFFVFFMSFTVYVSLNESNKKTDNFSKYQTTEKTPLKALQTKK